MGKTLKSFFYIAACAVVFLGLVRYYGGSLRSNSANAFEWEKKIPVYFIDREVAEVSDCTANVALERIVPNAETLGVGAIEALIKGLTPAEKKTDRYLTAINPNTLLQKFEIKNRVAYVDFNSSFNEGVGGSCLVTSIRSQVENTLNALPDIDSTVISVNGETDGILEP